MQRRVPMDGISSKHQIQPQIPDAGGMVKTNPTTQKLSDAVGRLMSSSKFKSGLLDTTSDSGLSGVGVGGGGNPSSIENTIKAVSKRNPLSSTYKKVEEILSTLSPPKPIRSQSTREIYSSLSKEIQDDPTMSRIFSKESNVHESAKRYIAVYMSNIEERYEKDKAPVVQKAILSDMIAHFQDKDSGFNDSKIDVLSLKEATTKVNENLQVKLNSGEPGSLISTKQRPQTARSKELEAELASLVEIAQQAADLLTTQKKPKENKGSPTEMPSSLPSSGFSGEVKEQKQEVRNTKNQGTEKSEGQTTPQSKMKENTKVSQENVDKRRANNQLDEKLLRKERELEKENDAFNTEQVVKKQKK